MPKLFRKYYFILNKFFLTLNPRDIKILISYILFFILLLYKFFYGDNKGIQINNDIPTWSEINHGFGILVNKYKYLIKKDKNIEEDSPIWVMWYQGIENAPPIVKSCIQSIITNKAKHPVIILSNNNLEKYIKLPSFIVEKFNKGFFSIQHFSDIIRMALLYKYGGYWIDATYFINTPLTKVNTSFWTLKLNYNYCWTHSHPFINCSYSINFMAVPKKSFFATYGYNALLYYLKKYNHFINYFLLDYIVYIAYINIKEFKEIINNLPFVNCNIFYLDGNLKSDFNKSDFCIYNKLAKSSRNQMMNGKNLTNYGYIIQKYKFKFESDSNNNL